MKRQFTVFLVRWLLNTFGIWLAIKLFGTGHVASDLTAGLGGFLFAGLLFSIINSVLRPIIIILSLPAILLTLGLFTLIVNGLIVYIALSLAPGLSMTFWHSVIAGIVLSLVNYSMNSMFDLRFDRSKKEATTK